MADFLPDLRAQYFENQTNRESVGRRYARYVVSGAVQYAQKMGRLSFLERYPVQGAPI